MANNNNLNSVDLPTATKDILTAVLPKCDILTVLAVSQASKGYHKVAFSKPVWLSLILKLLGNGFVDLFPGKTPHDLTVEELVALAKCIVQGPSFNSSLDLTTTPQNFTEKELGSEYPTSSSETKKLCHIRPGRKITLHRPNLFNSIGHVCDARLLPGGQYLLFSEDSSIECWSLKEMSVIWTYTIDNSNIVAFDFEVVDSGRAVVIFLIAMGISDGGKDIAIAHQLDFQARSSTVILHNEIYPLLLTIPKHCMVHGDFAIVARPGVIYVFHIFSGRVKVISNVPSIDTFYLTTRHMITLRYTQPEDSCTVLLYPWEAVKNASEDFNDLCPEYKTIIELRKPMQGMRRPQASSWFNNSNYNFWTDWTSVIYQSPLDSDITRIWFIFFQKLGLMKSRICIFKLDINLFQNQLNIPDPTWHLLDLDNQTFVLPLALYPGFHISYAGLLLIPEDIILSLKTSDKATIVGTSESSLRVKTCISHGSMAITNYTSENVVITYFSDSMGLPSSSSYSVVDLATTSFV